MNVHAVFVAYLDGGVDPTFDLLGVSASEAAACALIDQVKGAPEPISQDWDTSVVSLADAEVRAGARRQFCTFELWRRAGLPDGPSILIESIEVSDLEPCPNCGRPDCNRGVYEGSTACAMCGATHCGVEGRDCP